ncbi:unnamed protein product [Heligmosomoides polygyrus]|uniref:G-protein coupled receptors family 1 profile domain-containing protein n=1 Tax=Heligmosomoides polygyrus TaxID=6339 RepID=A0A3P8AW91_HELPZ|nr:unnamed protein product [Heligmosomoides polygyrus]
MFFQALMKAESNSSNLTGSPFQSWKMFFVGTLGLVTALISIVHNMLLFYTFNSSKVLRQRNLTYLMCISGCDIFISICYIAIMCVQVYTDYFESFTLFYLWHRYLRAAFTVSHITLSSSSFLLMAATIERYLQSTSDCRTEELFRILSRHRASVVLFCFIASCIFRGTVFFEVAVVYNPRCTGFSSMGLASTKLFSNPVYDAVWKFWIRKIVTVFLPFTVLASFNAAIVFSVRRSDRDQTVKALVLFTTVGSRAEITRLRSRVRDVTRMLVMVVCCYLAANIIDVVVAFWEASRHESLACAHRGGYPFIDDRHRLAVRQRRHLHGHYRHFIVSSDFGRLSGNLQYLSANEYRLLNFYRLSAIHTLRSGMSRTR